MLAEKLIPAEVGISRAEVRRRVVEEEAKAADNLAAVRAVGKEAKKHLLKGNELIEGRVLMRKQNGPNQNRQNKKKLEYAETQPPREDMKEQRGGPQSDQRVGETDKGAHNQEMKGRNPQGNKPERGL